ncbi:MAG: tryptophan-rich sensory protein [Clostridia bacterium]|nr:tryptophan-rich sensory protein [Clostridia bacterium]
MWKKIKPYVISIAIALGVGGLSALLTKDGMEAYQNINQPPLNPPMIVFPIVWSILFILMGIGSAIVYTKKNEAGADACGALKIYGLQLAVNFFWSLIFFNMQAYLFAFIWLLLLWVLIIIMIIRFRRVSPAAAYLQIPYLLWVTFAGYLTLMVYILNR